MGVVSRLMLFTDLLRELDFLSYCLRKHGETVLDFQLVDLAMPQLMAEADELDPCRM